MKNQTFFEKSMSWLALATLFFTPLVLFSGRLFSYITSKSFFFMGIAEIVFFIWVYVAITNTEYRLSKKQILLFLIPIIFLAALTVSGLLSPSPNLSFWASFERGTGLIFLYHVLIFAIATASIVKVEGAKFVQNFYKAIFYSGIILAVSTFISAHFINIPALYFFKDVDSANLMGNSSVSAAYLIFSAFIGSILYSRAEKSSQKFWIALGILFALVSSLIGNAYAAITATVFGAVFSLFVYLAASSKKSIRNLGLVFLGIMIVAGILGAVMIMKPTTKLHQAFANVATNSRFVFWGAAREGIKEKPVFGWGPENYNVVFSKHFDTTILKSGSTAEIAVDRPHNIILENFVAGGIVGGILYIIFVLSFFGIPVYLFKKGLISRTNLAILEGMFFAYFLQAQVLFDTIATFVVLFALFGLFVGSLQEETPKANTKIKDESIKVFIGLACVVIFVFCWIHFVNQPVRKAKALALLLGSIESGQGDFSSIGNISPMGNANEIGLIGANMLLTYSHDINKIITDNSQIENVHAEIEKYLAEADKHTDIAKNNLRFWMSSAELQLFDLVITKSVSQESIDSILSRLARAEELSPNNPRVYWLYGRTYVSAKDLVKAKEAFTKAYEIDPEVSLSQKYLEQFNATFGNKIK